jgi:hypothetical protein
MKTIANRRVALWAIALLPIALIVFACLFGVQGFFLWKVKQLEKSNPVVWVVPQALGNTVLAKQAGLKLSIYGYEFEVPWADIDNDKTRSKGSLTIYYFRSGPFLMFMDPEKVVNAKKILLADDEKRRFVMQVWGEKTLESNYTLTKAVVETSPTQISIFAPRAKVLGLSILLMFKPITAMGGETGIFTFDTPTIRGFQMGDPDKRPKYISVRAFDMGDHQLYLTFGIQNGASGQITQAEINRVLQTLRLVSKSEDGSGIARSPSR